jgi:hypothetical protein
MPGAASAFVSPGCGTTVNCAAFVVNGSGPTNDDGSITSPSDTFSGSLINGTFSGSLQIQSNVCGTTPDPGSISGSLILHDTAHPNNSVTIIPTTPLSVCETVNPGVSEELQFGTQYIVSNGTGAFAGVTGGGTMTGDLIEAVAPLSGGSLKFQTSVGAIDIIRIPLPCTVTFTGCQATIVRQGGGALIGATLLQSGPVGILVERIVGNRRVRVGRVPFGPRPKGRLRIVWNGRVGGRALTEGRYLITLRALDPNGHVIARATPVLITIP